MKTLRRTSTASCIEYAPTGIVAYKRCYREDDIRKPLCVVCLFIAEFSFKHKLYARDDSNIMIDQRSVLLNRQTVEVLVSRTANQQSYQQSYPTVVASSASHKYTETLKSSYTMSE